jgi:hypothetical protein
MSHPAAGHRGRRGGRDRRIKCAASDCTGLARTCTLAHYLNCYSHTVRPYTRVNAARARCAVDNVLITHA